MGVYATTPSVRKALKVMPKISSSAFPIFIWENGTDSSNDGLVNSYRAAATNQISNNRVVFGNWLDVVLGIFGNGIDVVVNPFSLDLQAEVRIVLNSWIDVGVRHSESFVWSTDAGNQS